MQQQFLHQQQLTIQNKTIRNAINDVVEKIEAKGRTEAKYASVPQNVTWIEG